MEVKHSINVLDWRVFDRLVACVKNCIKKAVCRPTLRFDELQSVISEVELTINSCPLVARYDESMEEEITTNHLLFGRNVNIQNTSSENEYEVNTRE